MKISIITAAYNEGENIKPFLNLINKELNNLDFELIFINDGSTDKTAEELEKIKQRKLKLINFEKRRGKSYALYNGFKVAKYDAIATLDCDLQDRPRDILKLAKKLKYCDFVNGFREKRKDSFIKKISSKIGNFANNSFLGINLKDNNCPVKVFKKECVENLKYSKNMHRFFPVLAKMQGFRVCEEKVQHFSRKYGKSKYGIHNRILGNLKMLFMIKFKSSKLFNR